MAKAMKSDELGRKVRSGDWVAFKKDSRNEAVAIGRTYESLMHKVEKLGEQNNVVFSQVPPRNCSLIL